MKAIRSVDASKSHRAAVSSRSGFNADWAEEELDRGILCNGICCEDAILHQDCSLLYRRRSRAYSLPNKKAQRRDRSLGNDFILPDRGVSKGQLGYSSGKTMTVK